MEAVSGKQLLGIAWAILSFHNQNYPLKFFWLNSNLVSSTFLIKCVLPCGEHVWWRRTNLTVFPLILYVLTVVRTQTILTVCFISAVLWHGFSTFSSTFGLFVLSFHKWSLFWTLRSCCEGWECSEVVRIERALQRQKLSKSEWDRRSCVYVPFK